jgi:hypothetical protein
MILGRSAAAIPLVMTCPATPENAGTSRTQFWRPPSAKKNVSDEPVDPASPVTITTVAGSWTGRGLSHTAFTMVNTTRFAPMARLSVVRQIAT